MVSSLRQVAEALPRPPALHALLQVVASEIQAKTMRLPTLQPSFVYVQQLGNLLGQQHQFKGEG